MKKNRLLISSKQTKTALYRGDWTPYTLKSMFDKTYNESLALLHNYSEHVQAITELKICAISAELSVETRKNICVLLM